MRRLIVPLLVLLVAACSTGPVCPPTPTPVLIYGVATAWQEIDGQDGRAEGEPYVQDVHLVFCMEYDPARCWAYITGDQGRTPFTLAPGGYIVRQVWPAGYLPLYDNPTWVTASPGGDMFLHFRALGPMVAVTPTVAPTPPAEPMACNNYWTQCKVRCDANEVVNPRGQCGDTLLCCVVP